MCMRTCITLNALWFILFCFYWTVFYLLYSRFFFSLPLSLTRVHRSGVHVGCPCVFSFVYYFMPVSLFRCDFASRSRIGPVRSCAIASLPFQSSFRLYIGYIGLVCCCFFSLAAAARRFSVVRCIEHSIVECCCCWFLFFLAFLGYVCLPSSCSLTPVCTYNSCTFVHMPLFSAGAVCLFFCSRRALLLFKCSV